MNKLISFIKNHWKLISITAGVVFLTLPICLNLHNIRHEIKASPFIASVLGIVLIASVMTVLSQWFEETFGRVFHLPIVSYIHNHWRVLCLTTGAIALSLNEVAFHKFGAYVYAPALILGGWSLSLLVIEEGFNGTIGKYIKEGSLIDEFEKIDEKWKPLVAIGSILVLVLAFSQIVSALAK